MTIKIIITGIIIVVLLIVIVILIFSPCTILGHSTDGARIADQWKRRYCPKCGKQM